MARARPWIVKTTCVLAAIAAFLAVSLEEARATPVLVHESHEAYYFNSATGANGTAVTGCQGLGCPSLNFIIGNIGPLGTALWEVQEKVFRDTNALGAPITIFNYVVFNDLIAAKIASFHVA